MPTMPQPPVNPVLERIRKTGCITSPTGETVQVNSHITNDEGSFLQWVIGQVRPKTSIEVGLAYGVSALFICGALKEAGAVKHVCVDPHQMGIPESDLFVPAGNDRRGWQGLAMHTLREAGYGELVELRSEPSYVALPRLLMEGYKVDFAFIDGWHTFDYTLVDFFYIDKMLRPGGVVVFDDTLYPSIRRVCRYVATNLPYSVFPKPHNKIRPPRRLPSFGNIQLIETDKRLGLADRNYLAFQKDREDWLGTTNNGARRWDHHLPF